MKGDNVPFHWQYSAHIGQLTRYGAEGFSMSKLLSLLAFAGDKGAARALVVGDVSSSAVRSVLHNDRSFVKNTFEALPGKNGATVALKALLPVLGDCLKAVNDGTTAEAQALFVQRAAHSGALVSTAKEKDRASVTRTAHCAQVGATLCSRIFAAVQGSSLVVSGKKSENAGDFGALAGEAFMVSVEELVSAMKPVKKSKEATAEEATAEEATAEATDTAIDTAKPMQTMGMGMAQAIRAVRTARAQTARARAERDDARAEVARLLAIVEGMQTSGKKTSKKAA